MAGGEPPILVIGHTGQLARALMAHPAGTGRRLVAMGRPEADLADRGSLARAIAQAAPGVVINAGAYTAVDKAQAEIDAAFAVNAEGPAALAEICAAAGIPLVHLSTDCVFDGRKDGPYTEEDAPNPLSVYGASKLAGERAVAAAGGPHFIVRVCWVFSPFAGSFVKIMLDLARTRDVLRVVSDQKGHPTHAGDLARALMAMVDAAAAPGFADWGLYHLAAGTPTDRASQAGVVLEASAALGGPSARIEPISSAAFGAAAARPANACLDASRASARFGLDFGDWREQTRDTVAALLATES